MKNSPSLESEHQGEEKETLDPEFEKGFDDLQKVLKILSELGLNPPEYCFDKSIIKKQWDERYVFPIAREGADGIRANYRSRNKKIMISFTNGFEDPQDPKRLEVTAKLREAGFDVR